ncbi:MAG: TraR/DksA family transcriptional regulator [Bacteroidales bacterium]
MKKAVIPEQAKTRYTDDELDEFKQIILQKLEKAHSDLQLLTDAYTTGNEHDTNDTSPTFKVLEEGYQVFSKEENSKFAARQEKFIKSLENALIRIENKSYGVCRVTGKLIPKDRLRSVPHATLSIEAKRVQSAPSVIQRQAIDQLDHEE